MTTITFRAERGPLGALITGRTRDGLSASLVAKRDLGRYYAVLANSRGEVQEAIGGVCQAHLVLDALNGSWLGDDPSLGMAWAEVADHIGLNDAAAVWGITDDEASRLVTRLRTLSPGGRACLLDAVESWWHQDEDQDDAEARLRVVGLIA